MYMHAVGQRTCGFKIFVQTMNYKTLSTKRLKVDNCYNNTNIIQYMSNYLTKTRTIQIEL